MQELTGPNNKILEVDLTSRMFTVIEISSEDRRLYLGGKGLGMKILFNRMKPGIDPLGPDNMIVFMSGVLMGTGAPCSTKFEAVTKSPLTGIITSSSFGGSFGMQLKMAGWDGLLIKGTASEPVSLEITSEGVRFLDADSLWGLDTIAASKLLEGENKGAVIIGPAGENKVRFANIVSNGRGFGRAGMGAVLGSKNLKAVIAIGKNYEIKPFNEKTFEKIKTKAIKAIDKSQISQAYKKFGTCSNVDMINKAGVLPVNNFTGGNHDYAFRFSGEILEKKHNIKPDFCTDCVITCGKKGTFCGNTVPVPEYETFGMLGANLGIFDREKIVKWNNLCIRAGMDTISAGGILAWVMEATQKGIIDEISLRFGRPNGVADALESISECVGFGAEMALGIKSLSEKYGGKEFAMQVKGLEMSAYDPRGAFGQGLSYAVANSGACHNSAFLISMEVFFNLLEKDSIKSKPEFVKFIEDLTCCADSLQSCHFTMYAYTLEPPFSKYTSDKFLIKLMQSMPKRAIALLDYSIFTKLWSAITGEKISQREFLKAGERIYVLERYMNVREGISRKDDTLPERLLIEWREDDPQKLTVPLDEMLDEYYKLRGFDKNGIPTEKTLKKLGIVFETSLQIETNT